MFYLLNLKNTIQASHELRVLDWYMQEGDFCRTGSLLVELESFKAVIELRIQQEAFLRKIVVPAGASQGLGKPIAVFSDAVDEAMPSSFAKLQEIAVDYLFM